MSVAWRWLAKAAVQQALGRLPAPHLTNYWMQRHVSRRLPRGDADFDAHVVATAPHADAWERLRPSRPLGDAAVYEFGAGYDLIGPASMWAFGACSQLLLDIRPNLRPALVRHTLSTLRRRRAVLEPRLGRSLREPPAVAPDAALPGVLAELGMRYAAPADARAAPLDDASTDLVVSTYTLEHIPRETLVAILSDCRRALRPDGLISAQIDLKDHYSYIDRRVHPFNFLRYDERRWRPLNPALHYQSRLRWPDYLAVFEQAGLRPVSVSLTRSEPAERDEVARMPLAPRFRGLSIDDLTVREAHVVLAP